MLDAITSTTAPNGLTIVTCKKTDAPIVAVQMWYKTGSAHEEDGIRGISHVLEHMMFRGSKLYGPQEHSRIVNESGGHCNAFTAEDMTAYQNCVPSEYLDTVLALEADRMQNLLLSEELFAIEKDVIIEEYHTYMNNPVGRAFLEFRSALFGSHPYGISPLGRLEDLKALSVADVRAYYKKHYSPTYATIVIVGNFESDATVVNSVMKFFGPLQESLLKRELIHEEPLLSQIAAERNMVKTIDFDVPLLIVGFPVSSQYSMALEILQVVMSQGESGRLHNAMVRSQGVAVSVGGMNQFLRMCGISFFFAAFTPNVSAKKVEEALTAEIDRVKREPLKSGEWEKVKNSALTSRVFELYSAEQICSRLGFSHTVEGDYKLWVNRLKALDTLTPNDLMKAAQECWPKESRSILRIKPKKVNILLYLVGFFRQIFHK